MAAKKKRPGKKAKAAQRILKESELLSNANAARSNESGQEFKSVDPSPRTSTAIKPRPDKKRG
jgi:hypothetical protein